MTNPFLWLIETLIRLYIYILVAAAVMSWLMAFGVVNSQNPTVRMIWDFLCRVTEPEELGPFILRHLKRDGSLHNRFNFFTNIPNEVQTYLMEGWMWLEREGFIGIKPNDQFGLQYFVTRKGDRVAQEEDFEAYRKAGLFPAYVDAVLIRMVKPLFIRGDYDTAVFRAFKEVEVRVRKKAGYGNEEYGRDLMVHAFGPNGPLTDKTAPKGEQDSRRELFAGAISQCKNPSSHREVQPRRST
jgi:uncharacterized protein (TIGR02391 family)